MTTAKNKIILKKYHHKNINIIEVGVDEVGRGPLFGRVYTASVILPKDDSFNHSIIKDSKLFNSTNKIKIVSDYIKQHALSWSISYEESDIIDKINILQSTQKSMKDTILKTVNKYDNLQDVKNEIYTYKLLIDGNYFIPFSYINKSNLNIYLNFECIIQGDNTYTSIAAASILAKVARDEYIITLCNTYPKLELYYNLQSNKGYAAAKHREGIMKYGITKWHRKTFGICKQYSNICTL
jgi:ribonuclease HII